MIVLKFGGTSIADTQPILRVASIVARQPGQRAVVVSALAGVTDRLVQAANLARDGRADIACGVVDGLVRRHEGIAAALRLRPDMAARLAASLRRTRNDLAALITVAAERRHLEPQELDAILAAGELMSSPLIAEAFEASGIPATWIDPRDLVQTDGTHGSAVVDVSGTTARLARHATPVLAEGRVLVTGGFVGSTAARTPTTLGRGGSDVTAAALGVGLSADEIQIWTDVDGILAADPRVVRHARLVPRLSFCEARDLAFFGAKVLHPATLDLAEPRRIPVRVLNSRKPDAASGTLVSDPVQPRATAIAIACRRQVCVAALEPRAGSATTLFGDALGLVQRALPQPILAVTDDDRVIAAFDDALIAEEFSAGVRDVANVRLEREVALLAAVAEGLAESPRALDDLAAGLDGLTVHALARASSGHGAIAIVDDVDLPVAMARLHDRYAPSPGNDSSTDRPSSDANMPGGTALAGASS